MLTVAAPPRLLSMRSPELKVPTAELEKVTVAVPAPSPHWEAPKPPADTDDPLPSTTRVPVLPVATSNALLAAMCVPAVAWTPAPAGTAQLVFNANAEPLPFTINVTPASIFNTPPESNSKVPARTP